MIFESYPPQLRTLLGMQSTVEPVFSTLRQWYRELYDALCETYPEHFVEVTELLNRSNRIRAQIDYYDPVKSLLKSDEVMDSISELLTTAAILFRELDERGILEEFDDLVFSTEDEREVLDRIRRDVRSMTPVHQRVQSSYLSIHESYVRETPALVNREIFATEDSERAFYRPLADARDLFFEGSTAESLRKYLAVAERFEGATPPPVDGVPYVRAQRTPEQLEEITKLEAQLVSDELMLSLTEAGHDES